MSSEKKAVEIGVTSTDPKPKDTEKKGKDADNNNKMSEEDARVKEQVELLVARSGDSNVDIAKMAVNQLADLLRTSDGGSVASVPKPLKYVRSLYPDLDASLKAAKDAALIHRLHDVLSFISMTLDLEDGRRVTLDHKLKGTQDDLAEWGHEYLRFLSGCIADAWKESAEKGESPAFLDGFVNQIVRYVLQHQDEPTAMDLLMEIGDLKRIVPLADESNYRRIAKYASALSRYVTRPDDTEVLEAVFAIYRRMNAFVDAAATALQLNDREKLQELFSSCTDRKVQLQMALMCGRHNCFLDIENEEEELLQEAMGNMRLSQLFRHTMEELDSTAPLAPDDVMKTDSKVAAGKDGRHNLACTFVSGLANCALGKDKYLAESDTLFFDQAADRIVSTTGALGLLHLWDHMEGLQEIDKYFYSDTVYIKSGACLASGIAMCGVKHPFDPALGLLGEYVTSEQKEVAIGSILGLGYAYAGTQKEDVKEILVPMLADSDQPLEVQCFSAYALAMVFVGTADEDICETMTNCLLEVPEANLRDACVRYLILALGCMFLRCQEAAETLIDATQSFPPVIRRYTEVVIRSCAFAGTGNVVTIQSFFHIIAENKEAEDEDEKALNGGGDEAAAAAGAVDGGDTAAPGVADNENEEEIGETATATEKEGEAPLNYKAAAALGIGLVAIGEELGTEMAKRAIIHVLLADTVTKKKTSMSGRCAVPLVYGLLSASDPNMTVVETLTRLAHDSDVPTAMNAILALGIVSAGSNNARVANKLRSLASYYHAPSFAPILFVVRLAQGLCAMGKGLLTLSPLQNERTCISPSALMGLLGLTHSALVLDKTLLDKYHYMFFSIVPCIKPRTVIAVDEQMEPVTHVQLRVGQPVDTVALPGKPKTITGFQTQTTPIILGGMERAEFADTQYTTVAAIMEGICVVEAKQAKSEGTA